LRFAKAAGPLERGRSRRLLSKSCWVLVVRKAAGFGSPPHYFQDRIWYDRTLRFAQWRKRMEAQMGTQRFFNPHVGTEFKDWTKCSTGGLLILSESAYGWEEEDGGVPGPQHPSEHSVKFWALSERFETRGKQGRYIAWLTKALCRKERPTVEERSKAWNAIAYSIYVQSPVAKLSIRPTRKEFEESGDACLEILEDLHPRRVIITSIASWNSMPFTHMNHPTKGDGRSSAYKLRDGTLVWCLAVPHQRARKMGWGDVG